MQRDVHEFDDGSNPGKFGLWADSSGHGPHSSYAKTFKDSRHLQLYGFF